jgi:predicted metal-binding membrane protein
MPVATDISTSQIPAKRSGEWPIYIAAIAVFVATSWYTLWSMRSMSGGMVMPGGWTMSMMWMPMADQSQLAAAALFMTMWAAMMIAMMLPSAMPMILMYRRVLTFHRTPGATAKTFAMATGYFTAWSMLGLFAYAAGAGLGHWAMASDRVSRIIPLAAAAGLMVAGVYQLTPWKTSCLRHCRDPISFLAEHLHGGAWGALKMGIHHGIFCAACCWGLMLMQCALGIMNLGVMVLVAAAIAVEKLLPWGNGIGKIVGLISAVAGVALAVHWGIQNGTGMFSR